MLLLDIPIPKPILSVEFFIIKKARYLGRDRNVEQMPNLTFTNSSLKMVLKHYMLDREGKYTFI